MIYGIGEALLAVKLSDPKAGIIVTKEEAHKEMAEFFEKHPKILKFKEKQEKFLRKHGYYTQLFGTKRRLPQIYSNDKQEVAYAIRLGLNFPCQGAAANMTNFGAILVYWLMRQGKLPMMKEVCTVHDAVYMYSKPEDINTWTVYTIWNILRNPSTKKYFGFQVDDVTLSMDFTIGRSMAEELPFMPGYDYTRMLKPDFSVEEYMEEYHKFKTHKIGNFSAASPEVFMELYKRKSININENMKNREKGNIPGFSNYYISSTGKLYSKFTGNWRLVKPAMKDNGYLSNSLVGDDGKRKNFYRHRLVASTYIPNPNHYPQVCHKDNDPENNRVSNLYWGTAKMNMGQCIEDKRFYFVGKERERKVNVELLISRYIEGIPRKDILEEFGISVGVLYKILRYNNIKLRK